VVTDHSGISWPKVAEHASVVIDTRGILRQVQGQARVISLSSRTDAPAPALEAVA
jgi:UDP-N-acetyl-D-mannosaminuronate dehydrogenase